MSDKVLELLAAGHTPAEIGRRLGVSRQAIYQALRRRMRGRRRVVLLLPSDLAAGMEGVAWDRLEAALRRLVKSSAKDGQAKRTPARSKRG